MSFNSIVKKRLQLKDFGMALAVSTVCGRVMVTAMTLPAICPYEDKNGNWRDQWNSWREYETHRGACIALVDDDLCERLFRTE
jgi:hypothetical protein